ncbi:MAG: peptidylprolyl isomerase [Bacteroidetes bacterium]|nr:peptidylprolyl isomerase [Bacteroidota bacterium]
MFIRNIKSGYYKAALIVLCGIATTPSFAQQPADRIVAVVGKNRIILQSDIEKQLAASAEQGTEVTQEMKCQLMQNIILQKMLVEQAERDSIIISEEEVEGTLDNRIRYFTSMYGSKEKLEEASGKTIFQLKEENRDVVRESMTAERVQGQLLQNVKITPGEVNAFFKTIPADSLPFFPATVEMGQIVIDPPTSEELDKYAHKKLEEIRQEIIDGKKSFETSAALNSDDPGSRDNGGRYDGVQRKGGNWATEFVVAAFKLQNGEISPIVKTKFGYHIIQMIRRRGDEADVRHILIKPEHTSADFKAAFIKLDSVRSMIIAGKLTFQEAVGKYSTDEMSNRTGGMITDPQTGSTQMEIDKLDPTLALMVDSMKIGSISQPQVFDSRGDKSCRIVYMKAITAPHKANLKDDYARIQEIALQQKKSKKIMAWVAEKSPTYYVKIDPEYANCEELQAWKGNNK